MRSLQSPNILWIHWRVYSFIANTSKGVLFLPPSDVCVRSFLYSFYTLIKLYCTKALSDQALSLAVDWILFFRRLRIWCLFWNNLSIPHILTNTGVMRPLISPTWWNMKSYLIEVLFYIFQISRETKRLFIIFCPFLELLAASFVCFLVGSLSFLIAL